MSILCTCICKMHITNNKYYYYYHFIWYFFSQSNASRTFGTPKNLCMFHCAINHKGLPNCAKQKLTRPGELVQAQTGILVSLNSTANKMQPFFPHFPQTFLLGSPCAPYSKKSQEERSILSSPKCQMFTLATWGELIELINFVHIIISGGSLKSGSSVYFGSHLI